MKNCKLCWMLTIVLALTTGTMAYLFMIRGNIAPSNDGRTEIILEGSERDMVLEEMRGFLDGVQSIIAASTENDMQTIAESAKIVGMANAGDVPLTLMSKLPIEFKSLGLETHKAFDEIAREAEDIGDAKIILTRLGDLLTNCTSCHATYRLSANEVKGN